MASDAGVKNIEQLALFGKNIKNLGQNMYSTMQAAQQRMNAVSEGWQDKQNDKFREQFDRSVQDIKKMSEMFTEYSTTSPRLHRRRCRRCLRSIQTTSPRLHRS